MSWAFAIASICVMVCVVPLTIDTVGIYQYVNKEQPDFPWPKFSDIWMSVAASGVMMFTSRFFEMIFYHPCSLIVKDQHNPELKQHQTRKAAKYLYLFFFTTFMVLYGWTILKNTNWLPWYLGGSGSFENVYNELPYIVPVQGALFYSYVQTGYRLCELLSHLFLEIPSNDFYESLLHHCCALFLNVTMIYTNFLGIGSIINFLHDISEVLAHASKFFSATEYTNALVGCFLSNMVVWFYTRNMVFTYLVYKIWTEVRLTNEVATF